ncbi:hypothetical protein [uncultured Ferrimonas sp.]|uniref:hypothetical protein n=1 Tax=uncultured Ferrimonas sp. TaxID=432640 RepID=UPI00261E5B86|nr:hypothetical protein [uncultured Ferrimonas sp.]
MDNLSIDMTLYCQLSFLYQQSQTQQRLPPPQRKRKRYFRPSKPNEKPQTIILTDANKLGLFARRLLLNLK